VAILRSGATVPGGDLTVVRGRFEVAPSRRPYFVQAVVKTATILEALDSGEALTLAQLAQGTGLPKPTVFRLATTLESVGLLDRDRNGAYVLGMKMVSLARGVLMRTVPEAARSVMKELHHAVGHSVNLAVLHRSEMLFVEVLESRNSFRIAAALGASEPLFSTAIGKAVAAYLPADELGRILAQYPLQQFTRNTICSRGQLERELKFVRECGYATDVEERYIGAHCVGAPVFNRYGLLGGMSISAPSSQLPADELPVIGAAVREAAIRISDALGTEDAYWRVAKPASA
jgi:DNA-binding IclR family transcriptional regulator